MKATKISSCISYVKQKKHKIIMRIDKILTLFKCVNMREAMPVFEEIRISDIPFSIYGIASVM
jgi:hypothetical protein